MGSRTGHGVSMAGLRAHHHGDAPCERAPWTLPSLMIKASVVTEAVGPHAGSLQLVCVVCDDILVRAMQEATGLMQEGAWEGREGRMSMEHWAARALALASPSNRPSWPVLTIRITAPGLSTGAPEQDFLTEWFPGERSSLPLP